MASTRQLKQQISDIILNDNSILKVIAEAVSSLFVEKLSNEDTIENIAIKITSKPDFVSTVTDKLTAQTEAMKQELYKSLSFDSHLKLKSKYNDLERLCSDLQGKCKDLQWDLDSLEQYGRRNCLLFHGIPESSCKTPENTDAIVLKIINDKLNLELDETDLDRSHRLGRKGNLASPAGSQVDSSRSKKPRPVIVKFISHNYKSKVFRQKRKIKGSGFGITESLTKRRMEMYSAVSQHPNVDNAWTLDGRVFAMSVLSRQLHT